MGMKLLLIFICFMGFQNNPYAQAKAGETRIYIWHAEKIMAKTL
jgi:hypothetical protein